MMNKHDSSMAKQIAEAVSTFQKQTTGHAPKAVSVVLSEDTLVITLHDALTAAEKDLAKSTKGAAHMQEFHKELFASSSESLRREINRITGRHVREATIEVEPTTGAIVHAFTTGNMVQIFMLTPELPSAHARTVADSADVVRTSDQVLSKKVS